MPYRPLRPVPEAAYVARLLRKILTCEDLYGLDGPTTTRLRLARRRAFLPLVGRLSGIIRELQREQVESGTVDLSEIVNSVLTVQWLLLRLRVAGICVHYLQMDRFRNAASSAAAELGGRVAAPAVLLKGESTVALR